MSDGCMQEGKTAIMHAAIMGHDAIVQMLLAKGAAPDLTDEVSELLTYDCCVHCISLLRLCIMYVCSHIYWEVQFVNWCCLQYGCSALDLAKNDTIRAMIRDHIAAAETKAKVIGVDSHTHTHKVTATTARHCHCVNNKYSIATFSATQTWSLVALLSHNCCHYLHAGRVHCLNHSCSKSCR